MPPTRYTVSLRESWEEPLPCCVEQDETTCDLPAEVSLVLDLPGEPWLCGPVCPLHLPAVTRGYRTEWGGHTRYLVGDVQESLF